MRDLILALMPWRLKRWLGITSPSGGLDYSGRPRYEDSIAGETHNGQPWPPPAAPDENAFEDVTKWWKR